jgi:hypothetical protein
MKWILDNEEWNTWECSECGVLWQFMDGTPKDNYAFFLSRVWCSFNQE